MTTINDVFARYLDEEFCPDNEYLRESNNVIANARAALEKATDTDTHFALEDTITRLEERVTWLSRDVQDEYEQGVQAPSAPSAEFSDEPLRQTYELLQEHFKTRQDILRQVTHPGHLDALLKAHELYDICLRNKHSDLYQKHCDALREYCDDAMKAAHKILPTEGGGEQERTTSAAYLEELLAAMMGDVGARTRTPTPRQHPPVAASQEYGILFKTEVRATLRTDEERRSLDRLIPEHRPMVERVYRMYLSGVQKKSEGLRDVYDEAILGCVDLQLANATRVETAIPGGEIIVERSTEHLRKVLSGLLAAYYRDSV